MSVQTTYSTAHAIAYAGQPVDLQLMNAVSRLNTSGAVIAYGKGVVSDGEIGMQLGEDGALAANFIGVVMYELNRARADADVVGVPVDRDSSIITDGVVWATVLDDVLKDSEVYLRLGATGRGDFSGVVGVGATLGLLIPNAKFVSSATAGELVKIKFTIGG